MTISQDDADALLAPYYSRIANAVVGAYRKYRKYPNRTIHRRSTRATIVNDEIVAGIVQEFDGVPGTRPVEIRKYGLRLLEIDDKVLLWFKKTDRLRRPRSYPTTTAKSMHGGTNYELFPKREILVVGYILNRDETKVCRVSINKPARHGSKPLWYIDLELPEAGSLAVMEHSPNLPTAPRVVIKKGAVQIKIPL